MADDYASNTTTSGRLTAGASVTGVLESAGDSDWFAISLTAGARYTFSLSGAASGGVPDTYLSLYSSSGTLLDADDDISATNYDSQILYTPTATGTYYLGCSGYQQSTGAYVLAASAPVVSDDYAGDNSTTGSVAIGATVEGSIETAGDHDRFAVTLTAGRRYTFNLDPETSNALSDPYLQLYSSGGTLLADDDDSGPGYASQITYTPTTSGVYYLDSSGYSTATGTYALSAQVAAVVDDYAGSTATTGRLTPASSTTGTIETAGDSDWFAISLSAGQRYTFNLNPGSSGSALSDPMLSLYDSSGTLLDSNDDTDGLASQLTVTVPDGGTYYLGASAYGTLTGGYTLLASAGVPDDDYAATTSTTGRLTPAGSVTGTIETAGDGDWFAISLVAGQRYSFNLDGASGGLPDPYLNLYNASGTLLDANDDSNGLNSQIVYTAASSGTYYLGAYGYSSQTGAYTLHSSAGTSTDDYADDASTSGRLSAGGSVSGQIERSGDLDWFAITLTAGQRYTFNLDAASSGGLDDPYLNLYNATGTLLAANDDSNGRNSEIDYTPATSGTYYLGARAYSSETGAYTLRATGSATPGGSDDYAASSGTTGRLTAGSSVSGHTESAGDHDWFAISLTSGQDYVFTLDPASSGGLSDPYLTLRNGSGTAIASNDDFNGRASQINYSATATGTYYLDASGYGTAIGAYQLGARTTAPTGSGFSMEVLYTGDSAYQPYFTAAAQRWAQVITGDIPDVGSIDDLQITASVTSIDGVGGILGQAGARGIRSSSGIPYTGFMQFDSADVDSMIAKGTFGDVVVHEMGHILGFAGYFFDMLGLLNPNNSYEYTGNNGLRQYQSLTSAANGYVPIEQGGGAGTAGSHWSESLFDTELMTGYAENEPPMPLSIVTIGVLQDLGYTVNYGAADSFHF
jgi:hypothetical protein